MAERQEGAIIWTRNGVEGIFRCVSRASALEAGEPEALMGVRPRSEGWIAELVRVDGRPVGDELDEAG